MANQILIKDQSENSFTITLASLADASGRSSASISNTGDYPAALVSLVIRSGSTAPDDNSACLIYLLRDTGTVADDNWGGTDAAITIRNATLLGTIRFINSTATDFTGIFDTAPLGPLGPTWGIAVVNETGQALDSTEANHDKHYMYYVPEIQ